VANGIFPRILFAKDAGVLRKPWDLLIRKARSLFARRLSLVELADHVDELAKEQTVINYYFSIRQQFSLIVNQSPVAQAKNEFWQFTQLAFAHEIIIV
jgi:hypothetical protein